MKLDVSNIELNIAKLDKLSNGVTLKNNDSIQKFGKIIIELDNSPLFQQFIYHKSLYNKRKK